MRPPGAHGHRDRLSKCGEQKNAPAFQPHGERLFCHVFEGSSTDEELPVVIRHTPTSTTTNNLLTALSSIQQSVHSVVIKGQIDSHPPPVGRTSCNCAIATFSSC